MRLLKTDSFDKDFIKLVAKLDAYLKVIDGDEHAFYAQHNTIDKLNHVIIAYERDQPVGCGAIKAFDGNTMEVKRMFTDPDVRGKGIATKVLTELEQWALELGFNKCILETGKRMPDAINLYKKNGYTPIPNYGQYIGVENSVCFEKELL